MTVYNICGFLRAQRLSHKLVYFQNPQSEIRNPQSNGLQPIKLRVSPQNIELNSSNKDSPDKPAIRYGITQHVDIDVYFF